jgi:ornithine carbamoyltransferase
MFSDVWVSMGEPKDVWTERVKLLGPYQVNAALMRSSGNSRVKFMHCLPPFHDPNTTVGREMMEHTGMTSGLEVTGEVFESGASIVFDRPKTGCTRSRRSSSPPSASSTRGATSAG